MLFSDYPQAFYPQLCITAVSVPGTEMSMIGNVVERFIDNQRIDGTLSQMINGTMHFIRNNIEKGAIRLTIPDKPKSKIQRYVTVTK